MQIMGPMVSYTYGADSADEENLKQNNETKCGEQANKEMFVKIGHFGLVILDAVVLMIQSLWQDHVRFKS